MQIVLDEEQTQQDVAASPAARLAAAGADLQVYCFETAEGVFDLGTRFCSLLRCLGH